MSEPLVFISGGSRGIGFAIAKKFFNEGARVILSASKESSLENALKEMPGALGYAADLSDKDSIYAMAKKVIKEQGVPDLLVNNGGFFLPGKIHEEEDSVFEQMMAVNMAGTYYTTKGFIKAMVERRSGMVVNMCSTASIMAYENGGSYAISKHAMLGFSKCLREEMKEFGVGVVSILPGPVWTDSWKSSGIAEDRMMKADHTADTVWMAWQMRAHSVVEQILLRPPLGDIKAEEFG